MQFIQTRGCEKNRKEKVSFSEAILNPSASFGGLYVPAWLPQIDDAFLQKHVQSSYKTLAYDFLLHFGIDIEPEVIKEALSRYDEFDDKDDPVPLKQVDTNVYVSELYHGPTRAFKDMALQPFGYILSHLAKERNEQYLIMAATSGDTGPATLETFKNRPGVKVVCLYPEGGTSDVQRLQMVTEDADNLKVIGIKGNFDDAQNALKSLLSSNEFKQQLARKDTHLSAANSVNFGRIIFQIIYHIQSYTKLLNDGVITLGDTINLAVPSGNFGNALGAYYAKKAGLPVNKILISSNENDILTDLITKGSYDLTCKQLQNTASPAMDILKSSNVERVLFDKFGPQRTKELMDELADNNRYELTRDELAALREDFDAVASCNAKEFAVIKHYARGGYIMDPHTATGFETLSKADKDAVTVIYSTAEWTKFAPNVWQAVTGEAGLSDLEALEKMKERFKITVTPRISNLFDKHAAQDEVIDKDDIKQAVLNFL